MRIKTVFSIAFALVLGAALLQSPLANAQAGDDEEQKEHEEHKQEPTTKQLTEKEMVGDKIHFAFDSSELDADARSKLDELASWAKENPDRTILVAGHTDEVGTEEYNKALGDRRAEAAKRYLVDAGVPADRIRVRSFGESLPVKEGAGKSETNRRDVFLVDRQQPDEEVEQPITEAPTDEGAEPAQPTEEEELARQRREQELARQQQELARQQQELERQRREQELERQRREQELARQRQPAYTQEPAEPAEDDDGTELVTPAGLSINLGGGVLDYFDNETRDFTDTAGLWEARLVYGTRAPIAIEAAYVGFAQSINALGLDDDAVLLGSLFEGAVRLNLPLDVQYVQPYAFGGVGVTRLDLVNESFNTSSVRDKDTSYHFPVGVGVGFRYEGLLLDIRGTVRPTVDDELLAPEATPTKDDEARLHSWSAGAKVGWEF